MVAASCARLFQLPRHPRQRSGPGRFPEAGGARLVSGAPATEPAAPHALEALQPLGFSLVTRGQEFARIPGPLLLRHAPEVGAVYGKTVRTDLCGGRREAGVPTAITDQKKPRPQPGLSEPSGLKWFSVGRIALVNDAILGCVNLLDRHHAGTQGNLAVGCGVRVDGVSSHFGQG